MEHLFFSLFYAPNPPKGATQPDLLKSVLNYGSPHKSRSGDLRA